VPINRLFLLFIYFLLEALLARGICANTNPFADSLNIKRARGVIASEIVLGTGCLAALYGTWYRNYPQSGFHFINDNNEWRSMDKAGHCMASFYIGKVGYESLRWAGIKEKKAVWYGGLLGFAYLGAVETFDGFSKEWGASPGDLAANSLGTALFISQQLGWKEQRILLKWSAHLTDYAKYNRNQLGRNNLERLLKDYNGQTYWLSANLYSLAGMKGSFPKWLNIAFGYGADGMTGARANPSEVNNTPVPSFERYSQFYLAPDIDLSRIHTRSKNLKLLLNAIGFIKFPMPAIEIHKNGMKFHYLYF
jgi:hypothetical protein